MLALVLIIECNTSHINMDWRPMSRAGGWSAGAHKREGSFYNPATVGWDFAGI